MSDEQALIQIHPEGEPLTEEIRSAEAPLSLDTFAGQIQFRWAPDAGVSSLGQMPFFIEFLKTSGLFEDWVTDCPLGVLDSTQCAIQGLSLSCIISSTSARCRKKCRFAVTVCGSDHFDPRRTVYRKPHDPVEGSTQLNRSRLCMADARTVCRRA